MPLSLIAATPAPAIMATALRPLSRSLSIARTPLLPSSISKTTRCKLHNGLVDLRAQSHNPAAASLLPLSQTRHSSYSTPDTSPSTRKKVTLQTIRSLYRKGEPITMLTAHDFPSAHAAETAGIEVVLVGDSLGMVAMGLDNTTELVIEEMILHCRSVVRGAKSAFIVSG